MEPAPKKATLEDYLAIPEEERFHELIGGEIVEKAAPTGEHGAAQLSLGGILHRHFQRPAGGGLGGWWFASEVDIAFPMSQVLRPDLSGWRRDRVPARPSGFPVSVMPDWVCEIVSPKRAADDTVRKLRVYQAARVPHYWIVDPREESLTALRWTDAGYLVAAKGVRGERVRAEPFDAIELAVGEIFGDDPE